MKKRRSFKEEIADTRVEISSGSIYESLGFKNWKEMETKSNLVSEIGKIIKKKKLTQIQASEKICISQPKLSELLNGHFRGYSVERLFYFLNALDQDVKIIVEPKPRNRKARVSVCHFSGDGHHTTPLAAKRH